MNAKEEDQIECEGRGGEVFRAQTVKCSLFASFVGCFCKSIDGYFHAVCGEGAKMVVELEHV